MDKKKNIKNEIETTDKKKATKSKNIAEKLVKEVSSLIKSGNKSKKETTTKSKEPKSSLKNSSKSDKKPIKKEETVNTSIKKDTAKTSTSKTLKTQKLSFSPEYYDLPYRYNQTIVKILAQTPSKLFVYWDISDKDRENLKTQYGRYLFEITKPVMIVHNITMNYTFEVDINDFANSWYLPINDSDCEYEIELGRRPIPINYSYIPNYNFEENGPIKPVETSYIHVSSSNNLVAPNDHILFNNGNKVYFRNIKTNEVTARDITDFGFAYTKNGFKNIYELYKNLYKDELNFGNMSLDMNNPSSGNPSSGSLSSRFK